MRHELTGAAAVVCPNRPVPVVVEAPNALVVPAAGAPKRDVPAGFAPNSDVPAS